MEVVSRLRTSFNSFKTRSLDFRAAQLRALKQLIDENNEAITTAINHDLGRCAVETNLCELVLLQKDIAENLSNLSKWNSNTSYKSPFALFPVKWYVSLSFLTIFVLIISPWNYPFLLTFSPLISAITAGCVACIKPSELSPFTSSLIAELVPKYLDPECFIVVQGGISESQELLSIKWDKIFFTGSTSVGKIVMKAAAEYLTPITLELGGKSPTIISDRVRDLELVSRRVTYGKLLNNGQTCVSPDYALVSQSIFDEFVSKMIGTMSGFYAGNFSGSPDYCRIISQKHASRLVGLVDDALEKAAELLYGDLNSISIKDKFIPPILLKIEKSNPKFDQILILSEEVFGPILTLIPIDTPDFTNHCIQYINSRPKPLALYIFSEDQSEVNQILSSTSSGGCCVNDCLVHLGVTGLPFGGVGDSGMGSSHSKAGFDEFVHYKSVVHRGTWIESDKGLRYPPYDERTSQWLLKLAKI
ncbi:hypothetical protein RCL1_003938 [Eukaryota sp. TZLM3-RCL]